MPDLVDVSDSGTTPGKAPDPDLPPIIASLYWVADGVTPLEQTAVTHLEEIFAASESLLRTLIQDLDNAYYRSQPTQATVPGLEAVARLAVLPWASDGLSQTEQNLLERIYIRAAAVPDLAALIPQKQWIKDNITNEESNIIDDLIGIGHNERKILNQTSPGTNEATISYHLLRMPFLDSIEPFDAPAVRSLRDIGSLYRHYLHTIVSRYAQQGGVSDGHAKIIPVLGFVVEYKPDLLGSLLDSFNVLVEERSIVLPHTGPVTLAVIRTRPGDEATMGHLEDAVRFSERFIKRPFPTKYIALHVTEAVEPFGGLFLGSHIGIREAYDDRNHDWNPGLRGVIHHEVSHYYWHQGPSWLGEGGANFFGIHAGATGSGAGLKDLAHKCRNTSVRDVTPQRSDECRIHFGAELFFNLYHSLGEGEFLRGLWRLYDSTHGDLSPDSCEGIEVGSCHLRFAFVTDAPPEAAALVEGFLWELQSWED